MLVLTGAVIMRLVVPWIVGDPSIPTLHGAAFIALNIAAMMPIDEFKKRVDPLPRARSVTPRGPRERTVSIRPAKSSGDIGRSRSPRESGCRKKFLSLSELSRQLGIAPLKSGASEDAIPNDPQP